MDGNMTTYECNTLGCGNTARHQSRTTKQRYCDRCVENLFAWSREMRERAGFGPTVTADRFRVIP